MNDRAAGMFLVTAWLAAVVLFAFAPELDLTVAQYFYDPATKSFPLRYALVPDLIYHWLYRLTTFGMVLLGGSLAASFFKGRISRIVRRIFPLTQARILYLVLVMALGPGLLVNHVSKSYLGRPRPDAVVEFGGKEAYVPLLRVGEGKGQSFTSGHASMGFFLAAVGYVLPRRRRAAYAGGVLCGLGLGLSRMVQGRHFLSDILFAGLLVLTAAHLLWLLFRRWKRWHAEHAAHES